MDTSDLEPAAIAKWDPELTERLMGLIRPVIKGWHRAEVRGLEHFPTGGALVVANHSGGLFEFGEDPDVAEVDARVRGVMQQGLDDLAAQRRFPVIG